MRRTALTALLSSVLTLAVVYTVAAQSEATYQVLLDNVRVKVTERIIQPGGERLPYLRGTDQVIVFLNDTTYERIDAVTGEKIIRDRKAGEVIWHQRAERAPKLVNAGKTPFRSLIIALK